VKPACFADSPNKSGGILLNKKPRSHYRKPTFLYISRVGIKKKFNSQVDIKQLEQSGGFGYTQTDHLLRRAQQGY